MSGFQAKSLTNFSLGAVVYVRYKDHVLFKNIEKPSVEAAERETVGWFAKETEEIILIEHDRTISNFQSPNSRGNGIVILKGCIIETHELPLQKYSNCRLNPSQPNRKDECALQTKKRKTQPKTSNRKGP